MYLLWVSKYQTVSLEMTNPDNVCCKYISMMLSRSDLETAGFTDAHPTELFTALREVSLLNALLTFNR